MTLIQLCREIANQIYEQEYLEIQTANLHLYEYQRYDQNSYRSSHAPHGFTPNQQTEFESLDKWKRSMNAYIDKFGNQDRISTLILTSTPIISSSTLSVSNNSTVEIIVKTLTQNINKLPPGTNKFHDFTAKYAREKLKFAFLDICFGEGFKAEMVDVNRSIQFVNQLIKSRSFKVIDMRAPEYRSANYLTIEKLLHKYYDLGCPLLWIENPLNNNKHGLDKLYYKPGLDELVDQIENDSEFANLVIQTRLERDPPIIVKEHLSGWLKTIRDQFLDKYYSNFDLDKLEMIVLGSSGVQYPVYNSLRALVADDNFAGIPPAVENFVAYLNKALSIKVYGKIEKINPNYDFECKQLLDRVLFLNICHSANHAHGKEWVNAASSIKLVNKILAKFKNVKKIAILDIRITMHTHKDDLKGGGGLDTLIADLKRQLNSLENIKNNYNLKTEYTNLKTNLSSKIDSFTSETISQDVVSERAGLYYQTEDCFKIVNPNGYHRYVRLGNPGEQHYHSIDDTYCAEELRKLYMEGYPIRKLFEPIPEREQKPEQKPEPTLLIISPSFAY